VDTFVHEISSPQSEPAPHLYAQLSGIAFCDAKLKIEVKIYPSRMHSDSGLLRLSYSAQAAVGLTLKFPALKRSSYVLEVRFRFIALYKP
jgi:hypothetical protein